MTTLRLNTAIFLLLLIFSVLSFSTISSKSGTFDEVQHFGLGKYLLLNQRWDVMGSILHPPLGYYLTSIPLLFYDDDKSLWQYEEKDRGIEFLGAVDVVRGQGILSSPQNSGDRLLILSRLTVLCLSVILGVYVYKFSSEYFGQRGGLLSLIVYVFSPLILAYSGICTQEMPFTVFSFIAIYYFSQYLQNSTRRNLLAAGIFLGCALATKFTALILIPFELLLFTVHWLKSGRRPAFGLLLIIGIAICLLLASYGFKITPLLQGNEYRLVEMKRGQAAFFNGQYSNVGWWNFYLVSLLIKTPIPFLLLYCGSILIYFRQKHASALSALMLILPVIVFLILFSCSKFAIGIRYLLPIFPFMMVSMGAMSLISKKTAIITVGCLLGWYIVGTLRICPDFLAYFNEAVGGADNGYRYLVDSNLDWGQDLKGLKKYMDANKIKRVSLSYFGTDSPLRYGIEYDWLPSHHLYNPHPDRPYDIPKNQLIAISATNLQGVYLQSVNEFEWLRRYTPIAKIGYSIFIYDPQEILGTLEK